jgi:hypothetical protein
MTCAGKRILIPLTEHRISGTKHVSSTLSPSINTENVEKYEGRSIHFPAYTSYNIQYMFSKK